MLAAQILRFGTPDVIEIREAPVPKPGPHEVLVAVAAASVNGHDVQVRSGGLKIFSGRRFPIGVGLDFVGTIQALGSGSSRYRVGDRVWGMVHPQRRHTTGSAAQYVTVDEDRVALAPVSLSEVEAAALVVAGTTALIALEDVLRVRPGQRLLVRGAAGGVGSAAVQIASALGVHVTALAGAGAEEMLRGAGAEQVLHRESARPGGAFDGVLDLVGTELLQWRSSVGRRGRMVTAAISGSALVPIVLSGVFGRRRIRTFSANPDSPVLAALTRAVDAGRVRPIVASVRPFAEIAEAQRAFERGGTPGKHVVEMTSTARAE